MMGLGEGGRKMAEVMWHSDGLPSYKNLAEAVEKALVQCRAELQKGPKAKEAAKAEVPEEPLLSLLTADGQSYSAHQAERYDRYQHVVALRHHGIMMKETPQRV